MAERLPTAILAGGLATRLRPITETIPKALVDVGGQPFILRQLALLRGQGVTRAVVCVGYLGEMVEQCIRDEWHDHALCVDVCFDGPRLLGTAGALRQALPLLGDAFFTLYGDSYLTCDFGQVQDAFERSGMQALMTVYRNEGQFDRSNVEFDGTRILVYDKQSTSTRMRHIDYGLGIVTRAALDQFPEDGPQDLAVLYQRLLARGQLAGFEVGERFYEIGSFAGLEETRAYLAALDTGKVGYGLR